MKRLTYSTTFLIFFFLLFNLNSVLFACDTTPSLTVSNVIDNGDDTFYMDIIACIGSEGSADGFDLYFNNDINILSTTVTEVESPGLGNVATVSVSNGIWLAYFEEYDINGTYFETGAWGLDCIEFGVIVDENPEGATLCSAGMNEDCLGWTFDDVFITCAVIPGPCVPNYSITDNGTIDGDVSVSGQNCNFAPLNDEIVELTVTCDGEFNFSLTQDESIEWPGESWLTIASGCCSGVLEQTTSLFLEPTLTIDTYLTEGTYYVIVDIEGNGFPGDYVLDIASDSCVNEGCLDPCACNYDPLIEMSNDLLCDYTCYADTIYVDNYIYETDTIYIDNYIYETDTVYVDLFITEYIDCDTGLPCNSAINVIIDKSKTNSKIYNLLGQEINRREGIYIEGGEVKYRLQ